MLREFVGRSLRESWSRLAASACTPPLDLSARRISPFSASSRISLKLTASGIEAIHLRLPSLPAVVFSSAGASGKSSGPISAPTERISARSMRFLSSRMLPGKSYRF